MPRVLKPATTPYSLRVLADLYSKTRLLWPEQTSALNEEIVKVITKHTKHIKDNGNKK